MHPIQFLHFFVELPFRFPIFLAILSEYLTANVTSFVCENPGSIEGPGATRPKHCAKFNYSRGIRIGAAASGAFDFKRAERAETAHCGGLDAAERIRRNERAQICSNLGLGRICWGITLELGADNSGGFSLLEISIATSCR